MYGQTSREIQNRDISGSTKKDLCPPKIKKKKKEKKIFLKSRMRKGINLCKVTENKTNQALRVLFQMDSKTHTDGSLLHYQMISGNPGA